MAFLRDPESNPMVQAILSRLQHVNAKVVAVGLPLAFFGLAISYYFVALLYSLLFSPLRNIPGPFLARVTRWWEYRVVKQGNSNLEFIRLHKKYGWSFI
jgi:hypothetical protein